MLRFLRLRIIPTNTNRDFWLWPLQGQHAPPYQTMIEELEIPLPPALEQKAIAAGAGRAGNEKDRVEPAG